KDWAAAHPDTGVLQGLRTLKKEYGSEPYNVYRATDEVKFPVWPLWSSEKTPRKTRIVVTSGDGEKWRAELAGRVPPSTLPAGDVRLYAYVFAWHAQHPEDTDYAAIPR